jgi:hypothetical protein
MSGKRYFIWLYNPETPVWIRTRWTCSPNSSRPYPAAQKKASKGLREARVHFPEELYMMVPVGLHPILTTHKDRAKNGSQHQGRKS